MSKPLAVKAPGPRTMADELGAARWQEFLAEIDRRAEGKPIDLDEALDRISARLEAREKSRSR